MVAEHRWRVVHCLYWVLHQMSARVGCHDNGRGGDPVEVSRSAGEIARVRASPRGQCRGIESAKHPTDDVVGLPWQEGVGAANRRTPTDGTR